MFLAWNEAIFVPELLYNLQIIVDGTENEVNLTYERKILNEVINNEWNYITKISGIFQVLSFFENDASDQTLSLTGCEDILLELYIKYLQEYKINHLLAVWDVFSHPVG